MTIVGVSKLTSKGQVTLPKLVRNLLKLAEGQNVAFGLAREGIVLSRCTFAVEKTPFTKAEWQEIEKLANVKGKSFNHTEEAKRYVKGL
jgi:AbrB family looped-hinge helix DNA binding protein